MMSNGEISAAIRRKKKALANEEPTLIDVSNVPTRNAQDVWNAEKDGYIEDKIGEPHKKDATETMMNEVSEDALEMTRKGRMDRLRGYLNGLKVSGK